MPNLFYLIGKIIVRIHFWLRLGLPPLVYLRKPRKSNYIRVIMLLYLVMEIDYAQIPLIFSITINRVINNRIV